MNATTETTTAAAATLSRAVVQLQQASVYTSHLARAYLNAGQQAEKTTGPARDAWLEQEADLEERWPSASELYWYRSEHHAACARAARTPTKARRGMLVHTSDGRCLLEWQWSDVDPMADSLPMHLWSLEDGTLRASLWVAGTVECYALSASAGDAGPEELRACLAALDD